jgi:hypothetical protein
MRADIVPGVLFPDYEINLQRFHSEEGRKYLIAYTILCVITVVTNARIGQSAGASQWPAQNIGPSRIGGLALTIQIAGGI